VSPSSYSIEQFRADIEAVAAAEQSARDVIAKAELRGGSLQVCERQHRAFEEGREYWWNEVKPKTMRPNSKPYAFSYFAKYLRQTAGVHPSQAYRKESAHLLVSGDTFRHGEKSPESEAQLRPFGRLIKTGYADHIGDVWRAAVEAADGEQPTMAQVSAQVKAFLDQHRAASKSKGGPKARPITMQERVERSRREALSAIEALIELDAYEATQLLQTELAKAQAISTREDEAIRTAIRAVQ
jgi:hypothetical protein